jgi:hypothetical protein
LRMGEVVGNFNGGSDALCAPDGICGHGCALSRCGFDGSGRRPSGGLQA